jgi:hypothetical protein
MLLVTSQLTAPLTPPDPPLPASSPLPAPELGPAPVLVLAPEPELVGELLLTPSPVQNPLAANYLIYNGPAANVYAFSYCLFPSNLLPFL